MASGSAIRAGRAFVEAYLDDTRLERGLRNAQRKLRNFGAGVAKIGAGLSGIGAAVLGPLAAATRLFGKTGDELHKTAGRTGASVEALSELQYAAEQSGKDIGILEKGFKGMAKTLYEAERGSTTATDALGALGLTLADLQGLSPEDQFTLLADRIGGIEDPSRRSGIAMKVLGNAGRELLPMFEGGADGISKLRAEAAEFALTVGTEDANAAAKFTDALNLLWRVVKRGIFSIGAGLAPAITDLAMRAARIGAVIVKWIDQNRQLIVSVAKIAAGVFAVGAVISVAGTAIIGLGAVLGAAAAIVSAFGTAISAAIGVVGFLVSPLGLVIAAVAALGVWFIKSTDIVSQTSEWLGRKFGALATIATDAFGSIRDALAAGDIQAAAGVLWAGVKLIWQQGTAGLEERWIKSKAAIFDVWRNLQMGISSAWIKTIAALQSAWAGFTGWFKTKVSDWQNVVAKAYVKARATMDKSFTDEMAAEVTSRLDKQHADEVGGIDKETAARSAEIESGLRDQLDTLSEMGAEGDAAARKRTAAELERAAKELVDAQRAFSDAKAAVPKPAGGETADDGPGSGSGLDPLNAAMSTAPNTGGTFSAMAGRMFGGGQDIAKQQLTFLQQIAANTEKAERAARDGMAYGH